MKLKAEITALRGLHAKSAAKLCTLARTFQSQIWLSREDTEEVLASDISDER